MFAGHASLTSFTSLYYCLYDAGAALGLLFLIRSRGWSWPRLSFARVMANVRPILVRSVRFWFLGVAALLCFLQRSNHCSQDSRPRGGGRFQRRPEAFTVLITVHFTVLTPLWSAYTHAAEHDDWVWIDRALKRSLTITAPLIGTGALALVLFAGPLLHLWVGRDIHNSSLVFALAGWAGMYAITNCYSVVLNGLDTIRRQTYLAVAAAIVNWPLT